MAKKRLGQHKKTNTTYFGPRASRQYIGHDDATTGVGVKRRSLQLDLEACRYTVFFLPKHMRSLDFLIDFFLLFLREGSVG